MSPAVLPDYVVDDPGLTRLPRDELRRRQGERLRAIVAYAHAASGFWRRRLDEAGIEPAAVRGIEDLGALPLTTRAELDAEQREHPPFGDYTCSPRETWMGILILGGNAARIFKLDVPHTRLFKPPSDHVGRVRKRPAAGVH